MSLSTWILVVAGTLVYLAVLAAPFVLPPSALGNPSPVPSRGEGRRGGFMEWIAHKVTLFLGRITFAVLHMFEKLGVNMADVDQVLAEWTTWSENIKTQLADALADAQELRDTDAEQDAAQANALSEALAAKVQAAYDAVTQPPAPPVEEPPVEEPPVVEEPVVTDNP